MNVGDLRGILQYVPRFRDRVFVVAIDGELIESPIFSNILMDVAVLRSLNVKIILVHGASYQLRRLAAERAIEISSSDGLGITDDPTLRLALDATSRATHEIMEGLTTVDLRAASSNSIIAHPAGIVKGVDQQNTGRVEKVDTQALELFLRDGIVPVLPPMGFDGEGRTYRVNAEAVAVEVAEAIRAAKMIFLGAHSPLVQEGQVVRQLAVSEAEKIVLAQEVADAPKVVISKLGSAVRACRQGITRVHLLDGRQDGALLTEVFSKEGIGTMVYSNEYQQIRRVMKKDVRSVLQLIRQSVDDEALVRRSHTDILANLQDYWLLEIDRTPVGCVALHPYESEGKAELACLYISKSHENRGYGRIMMQFVEDQARKRSVHTLFALSTQAFVYLQQKGGFTEASEEVLPRKRRERFVVSGRNSKILAKHLAAEGKKVSKTN